MRPRLISYEVVLDDAMLLNAMWPWRSEAVKSTGWEVSPIPFCIDSQLRDFLDRPSDLRRDLEPAWISSRSALRSPRLLATQIPEHCIHCDVPGSRVEQHCALRAVSGRCSSLLNGVGGGLTTFREISLQDERRHVDSLSMPRDCNDPGHHQIK